jgi:RNA ligase (TIGR02306 family)
MRKLASIQRVLSVRPIPGADLIEAVDVLGWTVVCKKGQFAPGDLCVYFEIDSFLNAEDTRYAAFEDRFTNWGTKRGMRLKTIKLRKQISQGLIMPISDYFELSPSVRINPVVEGEDVTELLKIEKWEPAEEAASNAGGVGKVAGSKPFPSFLRKTDQERVQNYIGELPKVADQSFEITIKLDGSSMTVFHVNKMSPHYAHVMEDIEIRAMKRMSWLGKRWYAIKKAVGLVQSPTFVDGLCSRNIQLDIDDGNHFSQYVREHGLLEALENYGQNIAVQGELIAPSIQGNYEKVAGFEFYVYDVFDIDAQRYFSPEVAREIVQALGMKYVPVLQQEAKLSDFGLEEGVSVRDVVDNILTFAEGDGMNKGVKREGVVFKSNQTGFSFKAISTSYLIARG